MCGACDWPLPLAILARADLARTGACLYHSRPDVAHDHGHEARTPADPDGSASSVSTPAPRAAVGGRAAMAPLTSTNYSSKGNLPKVNLACHRARE